MSTPPLKIELKSITYNSTLSQETSAYSATLIIDGKKVGTVMNAGHGGCDDFHPAKGFTYQVYRDADKRIEAEYPERKLDLGDRVITMPNSLESVCADLLNTYLVSRDVRRSMSKYVLFYKNGVPPEGERALLQIALKGLSVELALKHTRTKYPDAFILNEQSLDKAIEQYLRAG